MASMLDQIRASKLPSNMMQFAARGALQVSPAENIEILVHLARHNKVFGDLARMTLAGWDEKSSLAAASNPETSQEVLNYFISPDNVRPKLLPALLENPSVSEAQLVKLSGSALRETLEIMLKSQRVRSLKSVLQNLRSSPYLRKEEAPELQQWLDALAHPGPQADSAAPALPEAGAPGLADFARPGNPVSEASEAALPSIAASAPAEISGASEPLESAEATVGMDDESVFSYLQEHAADIAAEGEKPFQAIGGLIDLMSDSSEESPDAPAPSVTAAPAPVKPKAPVAPKPPQDTKRLNTVQKINALDVKGRIQLALKGNKEERSILIRDGTKVVALAVLEAPKLADGEVEKFASQKNVLEAVLRQIPLKRRFMKNYIIVRNLVANPRTPLDLGLGLMKNLLAQDLKNLSANKEVSETIRKLALKMFKQKMESANKK